MCGRAQQIHGRMWTVRGRRFGPDLLQVFGREGETHEVHPTDLPGFIRRRQGCVEALRGRCCREFERDLRAMEATARRHGSQRLLLRALATGADHAHLMWRALRPELIATRLIVRHVHLLPAGQHEPFTPPPATKRPLHPRPPPGQELHDLEAARGAAHG